MESGKIYFFTATINHWLPLLKYENHSKLILSSLSFLSNKALIKVYGLVIMPNHIHFIWEMLEMNGKELPHASFLKFTSHGFLKSLRNINPDFLENFKVDKANKSYEFWKRDSLGIELFTPKIIYQKLDYIHNNPCRKKWMLSNDPLDYPFSSYNFYETGMDNFGFLSHIGERIG
jgi:REP element-mobilizing transposase RayT